MSFDEGDKWFDKRDTYGTIRNMKKRIAVYLDPEVHKRFKASAALDGLSLSAWLVKHAHSSLGEATDAKGNQIGDVYVEGDRAYGHARIIVGLEPGGIPIFAPEGPVESDL